MSSNYPAAIDSDQNLYLVHDSLRLRLADDYNPGDTSITIEGDAETFSRFPPTGIITLTEQCSDANLRAISFFYNGLGTDTFNNLQLLPGFIDNIKPQRITDVTLSVVAEHHNALKDALIAIQNFVGIKGQISSVPLVGTMEARINFLRKLVLQPVAWFSAANRLGIIPLCLTFNDLSVMNPTSWLWNFGDGTIVSIISGFGISNGTISHCYYEPAIYPVSLTVENNFGSNSVTIQDYVTARTDAPNPAQIGFTAAADQIVSNGVIRSLINEPIQISVINNGQNILDPVVSYVWDLQDDLSHDNTNQTIAEYSIGGYYDVRLECITNLDAYRFTIFTDAIDSVEVTNLWHFIFDPNAPSGGVTKNLFVYEFGLLSEVYKNASPAIISVTRQYNFLNGQINSAQQIQEFERNNGFGPQNTVPSGNSGIAMIFWASGASTNTLPQFINFLQFNGFFGIYSTPLINGVSSAWARFWNWFYFATPDQLHFLFGVPGTYPQPTGSPTNLNQDSVMLNNLAVATTTFQAGNLLNGAIELQNNVGAGLDGDFSVYRPCWNGPNGYFVKNETSGAFFSLNGFYQTQTISPGLEIQNIIKLSSMPGTVKVEGQLVSLASGLYFFNNSGEVLAYDVTTNQWFIGGPGVNSVAFRALQDQTVTGYNNPANTLIAASDNDHNAYLFFDYSVNANIVFNDVSSTFRQLPTRPSGEQFLGGIY